MSWFEPIDVPCERCGAPLPGVTAETVNAVRAPWARAQVLEGSFHIATCAACGSKARLERSFLYTDASRAQLVQVFPRKAWARWPELEARTAETFAQGTRYAPPRIDALKVAFTVRTVFGVEALADKLRVADAGLDDAIVELVKLELATTQGNCTEPEIVVTAVRDDEVELTTRPNRDAPWEIYAARRARYDALLATRDELVPRFAGLFAGPFVDFRRLAVERSS